MGNYVVKADLVAEGMPATTPVARYNARIDKWEAIVEQITGQVFRVVTPGELIFDGNDAQLMHFSIPIVTLNSIKVNGLATELQADEFRAFTGLAPPQDDRRNPKIKLTPIQESIFRDTHAVFVKGLDQLIDADWGFVEPDPDNPGGYRAPPPIKQAIVELVLLDLDGYFAQITGGEVPLTSVRRERTDGHEIEYMEVEKVRTTWSMLPKHILDVLALYRIPMRMRSPEPPRFLTAINLGLAIFRG